MNSLPGVHRPVRAQDQARAAVRLRLLTIERLRQPVATNGNGFGCFGAPALSRLAADCHRLQPRGSF
jgi:hypothetical protein